MKYYYCFLKRFNNYFNRKIIKYDSLLEYQEHSESFFIPEDQGGNMKPMDFNPNDNVTTEIIVNDIPFDPDYLLIFDADLNIVQRWFAIEQKRNRQGQWLIQVKRDVISDNLETLINAPIFVEKGMLPDDDPMVLNDEGMNFNQIKKEETLLKDKTKSSYIVGYIAKSSDLGDVAIQSPNEDINNYLTLGQLASAIGTTESVLAPLLNFEASDNNFAYFISKVRFTFSHYYYANAEVNHPRILDLNGDFTSHTYSASSPVFVAPILLSNPLVANLPTISGAQFSEISASLLASASSVKSELMAINNRSYYLSSTQLEVLKTYEGRVILYLGKFYKIAFAESGDYTDIHEQLLSNYPTIYNAFDNAIESPQVMANNGYCGIYTQSKKVRIIFQELTADDGAVKTVVSKISSSRKPTVNQEFDMFVIPADNVVIYDNGVEIKHVGNNARLIASALAVSQGDKVYDIQLLPYCPVADYFKGSVNMFDITDLTEDVNYNYIEETLPKSGNLTVTGNDAQSLDPLTQLATFYITVDYVGIDTVSNANVTVLSGLPAGITLSNFSVSLQGSQIRVIAQTNATSADELKDVQLQVTFDYSASSAPAQKVGVLFYVPSASFNAIIDVPLTLRDSMKIDSNCDLYRIVSPNYQGTFDFNVARNGGNVPYFVAYCTYKPYVPFIKVTPLLNYMYGSDFNDNRGLICAGDFSLPRVSSAWTSYQLQNKNYQNIFNRDIQNLDFMQSIERRNQIVGGAVQMLADAGKGAGAGAYVGGPVGAVVGGALGGITSGVGYAIDVDTLARTQRETKQLAIDKYNYQLGNIKALPYTLTKVGSFDISSKIFPFLEYYTCSDVEKEALKSKIKYESMTVMRIGTLEEFMNFNSELNYFKGSLIRNDEIADDSHVLNAIYEELLKGVYI